MKNLWHKFLVWTGARESRPHGFTAYRDFNHGYLWAKTNLDRGVLTPEQVQDTIHTGDITDPYVRGMYEGFREYIQGRRPKV